MRGHTTKLKADLVHDEAVEFLEDLGRFILPLLPEGWKYSLLLDPGNNELKYWGGNMTDEESLRVLSVRLDKAKANIDQKGAA